MSLNEEDSRTVRVSTDENGNVVLDCAKGEPFGPRFALLGTVAGGAGVSLRWDDPITENPAVGATEIWEMYNFTEDAHPIHIHEITFEVVNRESHRGRRHPRPRAVGDAAARTPSSPTPARSPASRPPTTAPDCSSGTATSSSTRTTR